MINILCFADYYLPGYKAGGPIRSISNFVEQLGDTFDIRIITRDHDLNTKETYQNVEKGEWNQVGKAQVLYLSDRKINFVSVKKIMEQTPHDVIYLNSFFSPRMTLIPVLVNKLWKYKHKPIIIAPRGEFSPGVLKIKQFKKKAYLKVIKFLSVYYNVKWQASSEEEKRDILVQFSNIDSNIFIAPNIFSHIADNYQSRKNRLNKKSSGYLKLCFISRISPKKNLQYVAKILKNLKSQLELNIYGTIEDNNYWALCLNELNKLSENVTIKYHGELEYHEVKEAFKSNDLFVFPTLGENFGHVIVESLLVGTPVLVSNQTPWKNDENGGLEVIPLDNKRKWSEKIDEYIQMDNERYELRRRAASDYIGDYISESKTLKLNKEMFEEVAHQSK